MIKLRMSKRLNRQSPDGRYAWALGMRAGYWPCVSGCFVQFSIGTKVFSFWYGLPDTGSPRS